VKAGQQLYFGIDDDHMNARGYEVVAKALAEDLRKQALVPAR
jgi:lysophospholipase L1-like esterase